MTEYTRPATWDDVLLVTRLLDAQAVEYVLIGAYALAAHGLVRFSEDVDVLVNPSCENARRWIAALRQLPDGAARELADEPDVFEREGPFAVRINDVFTVDVMPSACGHDWDELRRFATNVLVGECEIPVLSLEGLLLTKEGNRDKDRMDAQIIRAALAELERSE